MPAINEANKTEIIDRYLHGLLESDLLNEFRARLAVDEQFRNEVELQQSILKNITHVGRNKLRDQLRQIHLEVAGMDSENLGASAINDRRKQKHINFFE